MLDAVKTGAGRAGGEPMGPASPPGPLGWPIGLTGHLRRSPNLQDIGTVRAYVNCPKDPKLQGDKFSHYGKTWVGPVDRFYFPLHRGSLERYNPQCWGWLRRVEGNGFWIRAQAIRVQTRTV